MSSAGDSTPTPDDEWVPVTFDSCGDVVGPFLHGTAALLSPGDELVPGRRSNFQSTRVMNHIYFTTLEDTAAYGAELAAALTGATGPDGSAGRGHIYVVEPTGPFEDDPNVTNKRFPGNVTRSYRSRHALRVVRELEQWEGHTAERLQAMLENLERLRAQGLDVIED